MYRNFNDTWHMYIQALHNIAKWFLHINGLIAGLDFALECVNEKWTVQTAINVSFSVGQKL